MLFDLNLSHLHLDVEAVVVVEVVGGVKYLVLKLGVAVVVLGVLLSVVVQGVHGDNWLGSGLLGGSLEGLGC
jgi:hypothetical protein